MHKVCMGKIEELNQLADGLLHGLEKEILKEHILECPGCHAYFEEISSVRKSLGKLDFDIPADLNDRIMKAVRRDTGKRKATRFIYRYGTAAAALLVIAVFIFSRGIFLPKGDMASESAELRGMENSMDESDQAAKAAFTADGIDVGENYYLVESADDENAPAVPSQEEALTADPDQYGAKFSQYMYTDSAIAGRDTITVNPDGKRLDAEYEGLQDVFYASSDYSISEIMTIIGNEYRVEMLGENENIFFYIETSQLKALEARLGLIASGTLKGSKDSVSVRIISLKTEE